MSSVTVIGAGFVGVALASSLVARGCRVTLVAPSTAADGATGTSYEWLNSHRKRPDSYQALNQLGLEYWRHEFGPAHAEHVTWEGHVAVAVDEAHRELLTDRVQYLAGRGYAAEFVDTCDVGVSDALLAGALIAQFPNEGFCDARAIREDLLRSLAASDSFRFIEGTAATVAGSTVTLADGAQIEGDRVVIAAGNGSEALLRQQDSAFSLVDQSDGGAAWGFLATVSAPEHGIRGLITTDDTNLRPIDENTLLVQCLDLDRQAGSETTDALHAYGREFSERVSSILGRDAQTTAVSVGHRVIPRDGMTVAGPLMGSATDHIWAVVTHSGITLGPWLAEVIADEIVSETLDARLSEFRPTRFTEQPATEVAAPRRPGEQ